MHNLFYYIYCSFVLKQKNPAYRQAGKNSRLSGNSFFIILSFALPKRVLFFSFPTTKKVFTYFFLDKKVAKNQGCQEISAKATVRFSPRKKTPRYARQTVFS